jgi:hypothetical protein
MPGQTRKSFEFENKSQETWTSSHILGSLQQVAAASPRVSKIVHTVMTCLSSMLLVCVGFVILLLSSVSVGAVRPTSEKVQKGPPRRRSLHGYSEYKRKEDSDTEGIWDTETFPSPKPLEHTPLRTGADFEPD